MGESHLRIGIEKEAMYARFFPFIDYGCDLGIMAEMEKGVQISKLADVDEESDARQTPEKKRETNEYLAKMRPRQFDKVPEKFYGKGPHGYILYDIVNHRGPSAPQVTQEFRRLVMCKGAGQEHLVNRPQLNRMAVGGPRYATMGRKRKTF